MKDEAALLAGFIGQFGDSSTMERYLDHLAQTAAFSDRLDRQLARVEALNAARPRQVAQEILAITRLGAKGRGDVITPTTGWLKVDESGTTLRMESDAWDGVLDRGHQLMWTVNASQIGDIPSPYRRVSWREALDLLAQLNFNGWCGYRDWRIPTLEELLTLTQTQDRGDEYCVSAELFPDVHSNGVYWSSTPAEEGTGQLRTLSFEDGSCDVRQLGAKSYIRFVRTALPYGA